MLFGSDVLAVPDVQVKGEKGFPRKQCVCCRWHWLSTGALFLFATERYLSSWKLLTSTAKRQIFIFLTSSGYKILVKNTLSLGILEWLICSWTPLCWMVSTVSGRCKTKWLAIHATEAHEQSNGWLMPRRSIIFCINWFVWHEKIRSDAAKKTRTKTKSKKKKKKKTKFETWGQTPSLLILKVHRWKSSFSCNATPWDMKPSMVSVNIEWLHVWCHWCSWKPFPTSHCDAARKWNLVAWYLHGGSSNSFRRDFLSLTHDPRKVFQAQRNMWIFVCSEPKPSQAKKKGRKSAKKPTKNICLSFLGNLFMHFLFSVIVCFFGHQEEETLFTVNKEVGKSRIELPGRGGLVLAAQMGTLLHGLVFEWCKEETLAFGKRAQFLAQFNKKQKMQNIFCVSCLTDFFFSTRAFGKISTFVLWQRVRLGKSFLHQIFTRFHGLLSHSNTNKENSDGHFKILLKTHHVHGSFFTQKRHPFFVISPTIVPRNCLVREAETQILAPGSQLQYVTLWAYFAANCLM